MPVIADSDEPPAKCCKYCEESTHSVDGGPVSWRLTLDQDLIDTLKGSFPSWFQQTITTTTNQHAATAAAPAPAGISNIASNINNNTTIATITNLTTNYSNNSKNLINIASICSSNNSHSHSNTNNLNNFVNGSIALLNNTICVTPITIDTNINYLSKEQQQQKQQQQYNPTLTLNQLNGNSSLLTSTTSISSSSPLYSASSVSSINSNYSLYATNLTVTTKKPLKKNCCNIKTTATTTKANYTGSSASPNCSASPASVSSFLSSSSTSCPSSSPLSLSQSPKLPVKTFNKSDNNKSLVGSVLVAEETVVTAATAAATVSTVTATTITTTINSNITAATQVTIAKSPKSSIQSFTGGSGASLLATFSSTGSAANFEIISDSSSCNDPLTSGLLAHNLAGKSVLERTFQDIILLQKTYDDDMSDGEQGMDASILGASSSEDATNSDFYDSRQSPPKAIVDSSPLQPAMDKNKESLKVKLMVRRPHSQLVEQGIIPPLKTSPAIHEQCKQLERAKTSDLLKAKIQQRPNREDLERRHILEEDECHIDPSLAEKQRMLKKARLADQLNSQIQHRPGPLELIKKNILHTEKPIEKIVKEGLVTFKATSEGLLTRPQHPNSYVTFEDESLSSESDSVRQTPPCSGSVVGITEPTTITPSPTDVLQVAAASAGIVTVPSIISTTSGHLLVSSSPTQTTTLQQHDKSNYVAPPPPPPMPPCFKVKQETANLYEELCQSVAGSGNNYLSMISSPASTSFGSTTSALSPLSSIASPPHSGTPTRPIALTSSTLQIAKSDAPGKDKNRKKSKSKPVSKARTIKFHEYKGPPSAAHKNVTDNTSLTSEETSYQLMLEQQNCLLKFLETLNKNQSIMPALNSVPSTTVISTGGKSGTSVTNTVITATANSNNTLSLSTPASNISTPMQGVTSESIPPPSHTVSAITNNNNNNIGTPRPPPLPSPALSMNSSIPPSPATSYAESITSSIMDLTKLEKMKVSDLKVHLKRRNLPVSGPKSQLIERLRPYLPLEALDNGQANLPHAGSKDVNVEVMDTTTLGEIISSRSQHVNDESDQMDVVQQGDSPRSAALPQSVMQPPQRQTATIILSNEELLKEQQRKIDELQRQLQKSQQELEEIRQRQQQQQQQRVHQQFHQQTVANLGVNGLTLIATTPSSVPALHTVTVLQPQIREAIVPAKVTLKAVPGTLKSVVMPAPVKGKKDACILGSTTIKQINPTTPAMTQKMVVKQQLEAKIQKQKQAAAAAAAAQAQARTQAQAMQVPHQQQHAPQLRLVTQKTQTVLIPTGPTLNTTTMPSKADDKLNAVQTKAKNVTVKTSQVAASTTNATTTAIVTNQLPITKTHNNLGLVWNEGNQTIFLVGLNDQHMTAHTIGNISLANIPNNNTNNNKKAFNGHQRTNSLPSIVFPIAANMANTPNQLVHQVVTRSPAEQTTIIQAKPYLTAQQIQKLQIQEQQQQQQQQHHQQQKQLQQQHFQYLLQQQQQIMRLDIKTPTTPPPPPPPPPPPQYEEATKHLKIKANNDNNNQQQRLTLMNPLIKIKEEPTSSASSQMELQQQQEMMAEHSIKSEKLTDVLDILVKQGELPESALEPITPVNTPVTPIGSNLLMSDIDDDDEEQQKQQQQLQPMELTSRNYMNVAMALDTSNHKPVSPQGVFDFYHKPLNAATTTHANTFNTNFIQNMGITSPPSSLESINPNFHMNPECVGKSLDMFLDEQHPSDGCGVGRDERTGQIGISRNGNITQNYAQSNHDNLLERSPHHHHHQSTSAERVMSLAQLSSEDAKFNHFDEFELLELMSQQLEMDIGEANEVVSYATATGKLNNTNVGGSGGGMNGLRRSMNPSMQPSLAELMQTHPAINNNINNVDGGKSHNQHLNEFDAAISFAQHQHHQQHQQQQQHQHQQQTHLNHHNPTSDIHQMNHMNTTTMPMDVCDDFDNSLNSFNFTSLSSPNSNINTPPTPTPPPLPPPHPFHLNAVNIRSPAGNMSPTTGSTTRSTLQDGNTGRITSISNAIHPAPEEMSICSTTMGDNGVTSNDDAFCSGSSDIFDLFNMDDYKMSWSEGDFAV